MTKRKPKSQHKPSGRPTVMTPDVVQKLEFSFALGASDKYACEYAGINRGTFYDFCDEHPEFIIRKQQLRANPKMKSLHNIVSKINDGDIDTSIWYAEKTMKDEYSPRFEATGKDGEPLVAGNVAQTISLMPLGELEFQSKKIEKWIKQKSKKLLGKK